MRSVAGAMPTTTRSRACSAGLSVPRKGLIGAWSHNYPEEGVPGPNMGFTQESLRWWDHWLKGKDTGVMAEPMLRCWFWRVNRRRLFTPNARGTGWPIRHGRHPILAKQVLYLNSDGAANVLAETPAPAQHTHLHGPAEPRLPDRRMGQFWLQG